MLEKEHEDEQVQLDFSAHGHSWNLWICHMRLSLTHGKACQAHLEIIWEGKQTTSQHLQEMF